MGVQRASRFRISHRRLICPSQPAIRETGRQQEGLLPMPNKKTASLKLAASPALAMAAALLLAPAAIAEKPGAALSEESFKAQFSFNPTDPPERIYSHLRSVAADACAVRGERSLRLDREA